MGFEMKTSEFTTGYDVNRIPLDGLNQSRPDMGCYVTDKYCQSQMVTLLQVAQPIVRVFGLAVEQAEKP